MQQDLTQTRVRRALCPLLEAGLGTETYELAAGSELKDSKSLSEALLLLLFFWFLFHWVYVFQMSSSRLTDKAQTNTEGLDPRMDILSGQIGVCRDGGKSQKGSSSHSSDSSLGQPPSDPHLIRLQEGI